MRKAIIDSAGVAVNLIEVEQATLDRNEWSPPTGHTIVDATTPQGVSLGRGDTVYLTTGRLKQRRPVPPALPNAAVLVYGADENTPQDQFDAGATVNIKATLPVTVTARMIAVPVDRMDAQGNVIEPAVKWLKMDFVNGVATAATTFSESGRYGVGPRTSKEFAVPETYITVFG